MSESERSIKMYGEKIELEKLRLDRLNIRAQQHRDRINQIIDQKRNLSRFKEQEIKQSNIIEEVQPINQLDEESFKLNDELNQITNEISASKLALRAAQIELQQYLMLLETNPMGRPEDISNFQKEAYNKASQSVKERKINDLKHTIEEHEKQLNQSKKRLFNIIRSDEYFTNLLLRRSSTNTMFNINSSMEGRIMDISFTDEALFIYSNRRIGDVIVILKKQLETVFEQILTNQIEGYHVSITTGLILESQSHNSFEHLFDLKIEDNINQFTQIPLFVELLVNKILNYVEETCYEQSGLTFVAFSDLIIHLVQQPAINLPSGGRSVSLPQCLINSHSVINPTNDDDKCLMWCYLIHKYYTHGGGLFQTRHNYQSDFNTIYTNPIHLQHVQIADIEFPITLHSIKRFETLNQIHINIYTIKEISNTEYGIYPQYSSIVVGNHKYQNQMNVILHKNHYIYIININALMRNNTDSHTLCEKCHISYKNKNYKTHITNCSRNKLQNYIINPKIPVIEFNHYTNQVRVPYVIYGDFESMITNNMHKACAFMFKTLLYDTIDNTVMVTAPDANIQFADELLKECTRISRIVFYKHKPIIGETFIHTVKCYLCNQHFTEEDYKVADHCHITGYFRGYAHNTCNSKAKYIKYIPVIFHNLSSYDIHLFVLNLFQGKIDVIAKSSEKYLSLTIHPQYWINRRGDFIDKVAYDALDPLIKRRYNRLMKIRFIDSLNFIKGSLHDLAKSIKSWNYVIDPLLRSKGIFPYDYVDSYEKLLVQSLPSPALFYNQLTQSDITVEEYKFAELIWDTYKCESLLDYMKVYLETDVNLLIEIFQNFRLLCYTEYGLDPCHYITVPGLAWDACLKFTKVRLETISSLEMYQFIENGIRGGVSTCGEFKHIQCNQTQTIKYYDVNNLYGDSMCDYLPTDEFMFNEGTSLPADQYELNLILQEMQASLTYGYIFEVDLLYPPDIHDDHNAFPLIPHHLNGKLMLTFYPKFNYIVNIRVLYFYISKGIVITKIHRYLQYKHSPWMRIYIMHNNTLRNTCRDDPSKSAFFKLMNNSVYGKTMENEKKRSKFHFVRSFTQFHRKRFHFFYKWHKIYSPSLVLLSMGKREVLLSKPIYLGFTVLEYSKLKMYTYYYDWFRLHYQDNVKLLYCDTDSLILLFNNSQIPDYRLDSIIHNTQLGALKDEYPNNRITEFIGIKSKCYAVHFDNNKQKLVNKGVPHNIFTKNVDLRIFRDVLYKRIDTIRLQYKRIKSKNHQLSTVSEDKIALTSHDDKRKMIDLNTTFTSAWGHHQYDNNFNIN